MIEIRKKCVLSSDISSFIPGYIFSKSENFSRFGFNFIAINFLVVVYDAAETKTQAISYSGLKHKYLWITWRSQKKI